MIKFSKKKKRFSIFLKKEKKFPYLSKKKKKREREEKKRENFSKSLGTRGIGFILLRLLSKKKKNHKSKFSIP